MLSLHSISKCIQLDKVEQIVCCQSIFLTVYVNNHYLILLLVENDAFTLGSRAATSRRCQVIAGEWC